MTDVRTVCRPENPVTVLKGSAPSPPRQYTDFFYNLFVEVLDGKKTVPLSPRQCTWQVDGDAHNRNKGNVVYRSNLSVWGREAINGGPFQERKPVYKSDGVKVTLKGLQSLA